METMVRARSLNGYFQVVRRLGFNPAEALRQAGLDPANLADPEQLVPVAATCQLMEITAISAVCPTLGLQMAEVRQELDFGVLGLLLAHKRTLREVLQAIIQYRHLLNQALAIYLESEDDMVVIREEVIADSPLPLPELPSVLMFWLSLSIAVSVSVTAIRLPPPKSSSRPVVPSMSIPNAPAPV